MYKKTISSKFTAQYSKSYCSPIHTQCANRKFVAVKLQEYTTRLIKNYSITLTANQRLTREPDYKRLWADFMLFQTRPPPQPGASFIMRYGWQVAGSDGSMSY